MKQTEAKAAIEVCFFNGFRFIGSVDKKFLECLMDICGFSICSVEFILRLFIQILSPMSKQGRQMITNAKVRIAKF